MAGKFNKDYRMETVIFQALNEVGNVIVAVKSYRWTGLFTWMAAAHVLDDDVHEAVRKVTRILAAAMQTKEGKHLQGMLPTGQTALLLTAFPFDEDATDVETLINEFIDKHQLKYEYRFRPEHNRYDQFFHTIEPEKAVFILECFETALALINATSKEITNKNAGYYACSYCAGLIHNSTIRRPKFCSPNCRTKHNSEKKA